MDLSIIIVNYNSLNFIKPCLKSLEKIEGLSWEALIFDNGSKDGSIDYLNSISKSKKNFKLFNAKKNLGFSLASNLAANEARGDFLLFLNPDTELIGGNIKDLINFYNSKENIGLIGPKLVNPDGSLQYSCRSFPTIGRQFYESYFLHRCFKDSKIFGSYFLSWWDHSHVSEVDWLSGAFLLILKKTFAKSGGFDSRFFMYSEDTDLALKLKRKGYKNYYCPFFEARHQDSGIASRNEAKKIAGIWESRIIYFKKNYSKFLGFSLSILIFLGILNRIIVSLILLDKNRFLNNLKAIPIYFK